MGPRSKATRGRRRSKAASASSSGDSALSNQGHVLCCAAVSLVPPASSAVVAGKGTRAASASEEAGNSCLAGLSAPRVLRGQAAPVSEEGGKILEHGSEEGDKMLPLDPLKLDTGDTLEDRPIRFLMPDSEEDREILMKVKSEEGKILKLKKEYMEASEKALARVSMHVPPDLMALVKPASKKMKTKKVLLVKMLVPPEDIAYIKAMPCPVTSRVINVLSEDAVARQPEIQDYYRHKMDVNRKMRDYHQALVDQYDKFGYAVDEMELTDDEDEGEENALEN